MFVELVILACLSGGVRCQDFSLLYDPREVSLMTCMVAGQPAVALWQAEHPLSELRRWSCGLTDPGRSEA